MFIFHPKVLALPRVIVKLKKKKTVNWIDGLRRILELGEESACDDLQCDESARCAQVGA